MSAFVTCRASCRERNKTSVRKCLFLIDGDVEIRCWISANGVKHPRLLFLFLAISAAKKGISGEI